MGTYDYVYNKLNDVPADSRASRTEPEHASPQPPLTNTPAAQLLSNVPSSATPQTQAGPSDPTVSASHSRAGLNYDKPMEGQSLVNKAVLEGFKDIYEQVTALQCKVFILETSDKGMSILRADFQRLEREMIVIARCVRERLGDSDEESEEGSDEESDEGSDEESDEESEGEREKNEKNKIAKKSSKKNEKKIEEESDEQAKEHDKTPSIENDDSHSDKYDKIHEKVKSVLEKADENKTASTDT